MRGLRNAKGFTLIELLIVVVIIGILATVLISRFAGAKDSAYIAHANTMAEAVKTAAIAYSVSRIDGAAATTIADLQKIDSDIAADVNDMLLTIAGTVLTIDHQAITESRKASVTLVTGIVTTASMVE
ncbi:MAG: prepilin-type N-terminal cleavage/methylation domain-containing protein [Candidatus Glassbacteria bacterium]|nr:prepilin-type N-terminal cleavage/methylation domain-containing protein [Candidatus Glassbacteria bacterium]